MAWLAVGGLARAQAIVMAGRHQNFDVLNTTGSPTHGGIALMRGEGSALAVEDLSHVTELA